MLQEFWFGNTLILRSLMWEPWLANGWEPVPFASPIHAKLDFVYVVDKDANSLKVLSWNAFDGSLLPSVGYIDLTNNDFLEMYLLDDHVPPRPRYIFSQQIHQSHQGQEKQFEPFEMKVGMPTSMNELQERFFIDLVHIWRQWIDDSSTWRFDAPVFRILSIAFLRLAAWDFEVSFDMTVADSELPISFMSIPSWSYPDKDVYWFHGYLVVLQDELETNAMINQAVSKAKSHIGNTRLDNGNVHLIVISLCHIVFVELSREVNLVSQKLVLLSSYSATYCSSGFRALSRVLTSNCWKKARAYNEKWPVNMPPEVIQMLLRAMEPRDAVAFSQASFPAEECYYASESQLKNIRVQVFSSSIPCCGKRIGLDADGICCYQCYAWKHLKCPGLTSNSSGSRFLCQGCQERHKTALDPGGIQRFNYQKKREGCVVRVGDLRGLLKRQIRASHPRPELQPMGKLVGSFTIFFNGTFTGLAYGILPPRNQSQES